MQLNGTNLTSWTSPCRFATIDPKPRTKEPPRHVRAVSDSDRAGCLRTRRSFGFIVMHGRDVPKMICQTQVPIARSSGDSEWYALTHAGSAVIGVRNLHDLGRVLFAYFKGNVSGARGIGARRDAERIRHIETRTLWLNTERDRAVALEGFRQLC